ncbi:hypothetical protein BDY19DRAFT_970394 [Irpex rosettiformis]|uniref:Uncharacterized protein n=1 Tax=Irpex rosettiformis TaxID=378272 RepID=A0ACB8TRM3_9APHY|nr:hypothetical protein BDY19DRAFT_970394 [Irpex rosettiformis]
MTPRRNESSIHILPPSSSTTEWSRSTAWRRLPTELLSDAHRTTLLNRNINLRSENTSDNTRSTRDSAAPTPGPRTSTPTATSGGNDNGQRHRVQAAQEGQRGSNTSRRSQALPPPIPEFVFEDEDASDGDIWGYLN